MSDEVQDLPSPPRPRFRRWLPWLLALAVALPILVALVSALQDEWAPTGDVAQTELNIRAIPSHTPTIGVAGRFGPFDNQHSHPGPSMALLMSPVYRIAGSSGSSLLIAGAVLHILALSGAVLVAHRIGGLSFAVAVTTGVLLLERSLGGQWFVSPWNPWMPVTAYFFFLVCVLGVLYDHWGLAPLAVLAGTHAAQTHVSYMVLVHGLVAMALVFVVVRLVRSWKAGERDDVIRASKWLGGSALLGFVMWLPPLYDQLRQTHNLSWLVRYFGTRCYPESTGAKVCQSPTGLSPAVKAMAAELNVGGAWLTGDFHNPATYGASLIGLAIVVAAVVAATVLAWKRRDRHGLIAMAMLLAVTLLAVFSASRILGDFYDYVIRWTWPTAAFGAAVVVWVLWRQVSARSALQSPSTRRGVTYAGLGLAALALVAGVAETAGAEPPYLQESKIVVGLSDQLDLADGTSYLLRWHDPAGLGGVGFGLLLDQERKGVDIGTDTWTRYAVLPFRTRLEPAVDEVLYVVVGQGNIDAFAERPNATQLAYTDPRTPEEVVASDAARAHIEQRLTELGRQDLLDRIDGQFGNAALIAASDELPADVNEAVSTYTDLRLPAAVFSEPPGGEPFLGAQG